MNNSKHSIWKLSIVELLNKLLISKFIFRYICRIHYLIIFYHKCLLFCRILFVWLSLIGRIVIIGVRLFTRCQPTDIRDGDCVCWPFAAFEIVLSITSYVHNRWQQSSMCQTKNSFTPMSSENRVLTFILSLLSTTLHNCLFDTKHLRQFIRSIFSSSSNRSIQPSKLPQTDRVRLLLLVHRNREIRTAVRLLRSIPSAAVP